MILTPAARRPAFFLSHSMWLAPAAFVAIALALAGVAHVISLTASAIGFAGLALVLVALSAWRPALGCVILALAVPLTAGLGRDTVLPLLRVSEATTLAVAAGVLLHELPRRSPGRFLGVDLAIGAYVGGAIVIPSLVLVASHTPAGLETWRYILQPIQYFVVFWVFSRSGLSSKSLTVLINLVMFAGVAAAVIGLAQLADVVGVRAFVDNVYPLGGGGEPFCAYGVCRPTSILDHAPAFGVFALLNFSLALALAAWRHPAFPSWWLGTVMALNAAAVLASQTQAAIIGLLVATIVIVWHTRRLPRALIPAVVALAIGLIVFLPQLSARVEQQVGGGTDTPTSFAIRTDYWGEYFLPALAGQWLTGTGTVIPSDIPTQLTSFVDNEYLRQGFRAGAPGVVLLIVMYGAIGGAGWRSRTSSDIWVSSLGAAVVSCVAVMAIAGTTAEYLTFAGVSQLFWMVTGLFVAATLAR